MPYKRIMIAVDGSSTSEIALKESIELAKLLNAKLCILHVVNEFPSANFFFATDLVKYQKNLRDEANAILARMKRFCEERDVNAETMLAEITHMPEWVSEKIVEAVLTWEADLIIIGTHGRRGFRRFLLGSVAEETMRISPVPVLLVRAKEEKK